MGQTPERKLSFKDVQIAFLLNGLNDIERLFKSGRISAAMIRRALENFDAPQKDMVPLADWVKENLGSGKRGRSAPRGGQVKTYIAQQIGDGPPFLRLPLSTLSIEKGEGIQVRFQKGQIVVVPE